MWSISDYLLMRAMLSTFSPLQPLPLYIQFLKFVMKINEVLPQGGAGFRDRNFVSATANYEHQIGIFFNQKPFICPKFMYLKESNTEKGGKYLNLNK